MDKKSKWGYKKDSEFRNEPFIDIKSNIIDMSETPEDLLLIPNKGKPMIGKANSGQIIFPHAKKVREVPIRKLQHGGNFGLAGENTMPMSPFISLKPFINKYKLKYGGVIDYMSNLPEEQQYLFAEEFDGFDEDIQNEIADYLNGGYYQTGGRIPVQPSTEQGNAELESGETLIDSSQELKQVKGKKHSEGGEEMNLERGTRIYSEFLDAPSEVVKQVLGKESKKKYSYAELSKRFPTQPSISILSDPKSDDYQKTTAQLTLASNLGKLDTIFYAQEKEKQGKEGNKFQKGGIKKYQAAGTFEYIPGQGLYLPEQGQEFQSTSIPDVYYDPYKKQYVKRINEQDKAFTFLARGKYAPVRNTLPQLEIVDQSTSQEYGKGLYSIPFTKTPTTSSNVAPTPLTFYNPVVELEEEYVPTVPTDLQLVIPQRNEKVVSPVRGKQSVPKRKSNRAMPNPVTTDIEVGESELRQVPLPLEQLSQRTYSNLAPTQTSSVPTVTTVPTVNEVADYIVSNDDQNYIGTEKKKWDWSKFGVSPELAGTVADIGLALSDRLRVSEPTFYNRTKTPLFTRFVDFDDKEVQRMYDKNIQQIQQSNIPEQVKQAQISELTSNYQDYQAKVDFGNLQRYEAKRERDTDKLQRYLDTNIDQRVADIESYRMKKARADELRDAFKAQRKSRIVNSLKAYAEYADQISKANTFTPNYRINPITGRIDYRPQQQSELRDNILQQYQKKNQSRIDLGMGATGQIMGNVLIITDKDGKVTTQKLDTQE